MVIHRNGETDACGSTGAGSIDEKFIRALSASSNKYEIETRLTEGIATRLPTGECNRERAIATDAYLPFHLHCDRGDEATPVLLDNKALVRTWANSLPCRFYTREGLRISTLDQLKTMAETAKALPSESCANPQSGDESCDGDDSVSEIHLYAVPAGRVFHFAPAYVGETFELNHLKLLPDPSKPITLKVLSTSPKVFDILHVFTEDEAAAVVKKALEETSPTHKIGRSTTGGGGTSSVFNKRTSESGFDTHGTVALALKKRIFEVLGYDEYWTGHDDGLQVLRYNQTKAYTPHMDYIPLTTPSDYNFDSERVGGNRYATVLLYMTDMVEGAGGETVFPKIWPEGSHKSLEHALEELRESGDAERAGIERGSWEEEMVATCRSKFSVRPSAGRAVLFYSQLPNGQEDPASLHGGCPVLEGEKWAANLWVWNTPREDFPGAPMKEGAKIAETARTHPKLLASFKNSGREESMKTAELWYDEAMYWGKLGPNQSLSSNTFEGHRWNVRVNGKVVKSWVIGSDAKQYFEI